MFNATFGLYRSTVKQIRGAFTIDTSGMVWQRRTSMHDVLKYLQKRNVTIWIYLQVTVFADETAKKICDSSLGQLCHKHGLNLRALGSLRHVTNSMYFPGAAEASSAHQDPIIIGRLRSTVVECARQRILAEMLARVCVSWIRHHAATGEGIHSEKEYLLNITELLRLLHGDYKAPAKQVICALYPFSKR